VVPFLVNDGFIIKHLSDAMMSRFYLPLLAACLLVVPPVAARECHADLVESDAVVQRIVDGDTLVLSTEQRVRIIGVNTLEMDAKSAQDKQWARKAADIVSQLVAGKNVLMLAERDRKDRHGRLLAHIRLQDGQDVASILIQQGLGVAVAIGRNTVCAHDNIVLENQARSSNLGIWRNKGNWWRDADELLNAERGFQLIRAPISRRSHTGNETRVQLANGLSLTLGRQWPLDAAQTDALFANTDRQLVEVRGWIGGRKTTPQLTLHHPANLRFISP